MFVSGITVGELSSCGFYFFWGHFGFELAVNYDGYVTGVLVRWTSGFFWDEA